MSTFIIVVVWIATLLIALKVGYYAAILALKEAMEEEEATQEVGFNKEEYDAKLWN